MIEVNVKEARSNLSTLLDRVAHGEEVVVLRHGKKIARLTPLPSENRLPSLKELRSSLPAAGDTLSNAVVRNREEERY
ncbi:MAG: type II toxin-antitoxin system prevent-host-death family antitoxin [Desulfobulbaceae bacterium]|nr:type II toxin-antitoxin system prevent-host-death family antitoxin [Desulfobulbaceae bacterium]